MKAITLSYILQQAYQSLMGHNELTQITAEQIVNLLQIQAPQYFNALEKQIQTLIEKANTIEVLEKENNQTKIHIEFCDFNSIRIFAKIDTTKLPSQYNKIDQFALNNDIFNQMLQAGVDIAYLPTGSISNAMDNDFHSFLNVEKALNFKNENNLAVLQCILDICHNKTINSSLISFESAITTHNPKENNIDDLLTLANTLSNDTIIIANELFRLNAKNLNESYIGTDCLSPYDMGCNHSQDIIVFLEKMRQQFFMTKSINNNQYSLGHKRIINTIQAHSFSCIKESMLFSMVEFKTLTYFLKYAKEYAWEVKWESDHLKQANIYISIPQKDFALFNLTTDDDKTGNLMLVFCISTMPFSLNLDGVAPVGVTTVEGLDNATIIKIDTALSLTSSIIKTYWENTNSKGHLNNNYSLDWNFLSPNWHMAVNKNITSLIKRDVVMNNLLECAIYHADSTKPNQEKNDIDEIKSFNKLTQIPFEKILKSLGKNGEISILNQKIHVVEFYLFQDDDFDNGDFNTPVGKQIVNINSSNEFNSRAFRNIKNMNNTQVFAILEPNQDSIQLNLCVKMSEWHNIEKEKSMTTPLVNFMLMFI